MNIAIIGSGVYALSMAHSLSQNSKNKIIMWSESEEAKNDLEKNRKKLTQLGNIHLDDKIKFSTSYEEVLKDAQVVFVMCAAKFVSSVCKHMLPYINNKMHFIIGSKGIEQETCRFIHEVFLNFINTRKLAVISGPSFAIDIANLEPIGLSIATRSNATLNIALKIYKNTNIKLRSTRDLVGVELCGSIKNVIAVAAGILDGLGYSESTRSFLITESMHDIKELIKGLGGSKKTILSFAGVGDLLLTSTSVKSRNYSYGILLGKGLFDEANNYLKNTTVEGYYTLKSIYTLLRRKKIKMPVIDLIYKIVMNNDDPNKLSQFLQIKK
ncbi:MAG: NAD(P)H-dependent glycerol-3-phosphate dehydrogenase [Erysipelotrichales bacterium]|nr:NAD(P)H-dependent glycerol-3-phosphate dehydrogenase [Erysipelotrichales bacterium]